MGKKRNFSPDPAELDFSPRLKQTRIEKFLYFPHPPDTGAALPCSETALLGTPPHLSQAATSEPTASSTNSPELHQQSSTSAFGSHQFTGPDNLQIQHSLLVSSTVNLVFSHLEHIVKLLKQLLKGPHITSTQLQLKKISQELPKVSSTNWKSPRLCTPPQEPLLASASSNNSYRLMPKQIALEIYPSHSNNGKWSHKSMICTSISKLLGIDPSEIDLKSALFLPFYSSATRVLLKFSTNRIPKLLHNKKETLWSFKISTRRVFQSTIAKPLMAWFPHRPRKACLVSTTPSAKKEFASQSSPSRADFTSDRNGTITTHLSPRPPVGDDVTTSLESCILNLKKTFPSKTSPIPPSNPNSLTVSMSHANSSLTAPAIAPSGTPAALADSLTSIFSSKAPPVGPLTYGAEGTLNTFSTLDPCESPQSFTGNSPTQVASSCTLCLPHLPAYSVDRYGQGGACTLSDVQTPAHLSLTSDCVGPKSITQDVISGILSTPDVRVQPSIVPTDLAPLHTDSARLAIPANGCVFHGSLECLDTSLTPD